MVNRVSFAADFPILKLIYKGAGARYTNCRINWFNGAIDEISTERENTPITIKKYVEEVLLYNLDSFHSHFRITRRIFGKHWAQRPQVGLSVKRAILACSIWRSNELTVTLTVLGCILAGWQSN
ncbi:hypothetical protein Trydic_g17173 [Trypoxylus dichotomus]